MSHVVREMIQGDIVRKMLALSCAADLQLIGQKAKYVSPQDQLAGYRDRRQTHDFGW